MEAIEKLTKMLTRGEGNLEWKRAAENLGMIFLSDHFRANLLRAYELLKVHCPRLRSAPLIDLIGGDDVWFAFAQLVAFCIQDQDHSFPTRNYTTQAVDKLDRAARSLIDRFKRAAYGRDEELHFLNEWDPREEALREARRLAREEGGGGGGGEKAPPRLTSLRRRPKPADEYETADDRRRRADRLARQHLSGLPA